MGNVKQRAIDLRGPLTTIAGDTLTKKLKPPHSILAALHVLRIDLEPDGDGLVAKGETSKIDPYLAAQMRQYRTELREIIDKGVEVLTSSYEMIESADDWSGIRAAVGAIDEALEGGATIPTGSIEKLVDQAVERSRNLPEKKGRVKGYI